MTLPRICQYLGQPQVSMRTLYRRVRLVAIWRRPMLPPAATRPMTTWWPDTARLMALPRREVVLAEDETHLKLLPHVRARSTLHSGMAPERSVREDRYLRARVPGGPAWPRPGRGDPPGLRLSMIGWEVTMARHPLVGYLVWALLFGALFAWEGLSLARVGSLPALSDVFRVIMRYPVGRWALFALWLWAGWHFFVRGWHFLLRA